MPTKLAVAYNSLTNTMGISFTKTSRKIPPPIAVKMPANVIIKKLNPKLAYAKVDPIIVNTPNPIASNFRKIFQCFLILEYRKKTNIPVMMQIERYVGLIIATGGYLPNITSRIIPPASPVIIERIITPTMSDFCSIALNAPVTANAIVPK